MRVPLSNQFTQIKRFYPVSALLSNFKDISVKNSDETFYIPSNGTV